MFEHWCNRAIIILPKKIFITNLHTWRYPKLLIVLIQIFHFPEQNPWKVSKKSNWLLFEHLSMSTVTVYKNIYLCMLHEERFNYFYHPMLFTSSIQSKKLLRKKWKMKISLLLTNGIGVWNDMNSAPLWEQTTITSTLVYATNILAIIWQSVTMVTNILYISVMSKKDGKYWNPLLL